MAFGSRGAISETHACFATHTMLNSLYLRMIADTSHKAENARAPTVREALAVTSVGFSVSRVNCFAISPCTGYAAKESLA